MPFLQRTRQHTTAAAGKRNLIFILHVLALNPAGLKTQRAFAIPFAARKPSLISKVKI